MRARRIAVTTCLFLTMGSVARAQLRRVTAEVEPVVESDLVHHGTVVRAALIVRLPEGYHVNSNTPRDPSLIPTVLTVDPPAGVSVAEVVYPPSTDLKQAGQDQPLAVFEREFTIGVRFAVGRDVPPGDVIVPARLRYQACDATMCYIPATVTSRWAVRVVSDSTPVVPPHAGMLDSIPFGRGAAPVAGGAAGGRRGSGADDGGLAQLNDFAVVATTGGYLRPDDFLQFIRDAESGVKPKGLFEGRGPLAILLIVFAGGLALNLTPCVLPMIPINLAIIGAGAQAGSRARGLLLGAAYGGAMAIVYGVLGLVVILTAGTFGTINSSPWFNLAIAVVFIVLALAMFDVIVIDFSRLSGRFRPGAGRGSLLLAFSMGGVAALLAGACVAPVVIQVVLFASNLYSTGTTSALCLPFVLGLGMAVPWPIAGAGLASLPKPGLWMVRVKQAFGVLILATAGYYGYEAYGLFANRFVDPAAVASSVQEKVRAGWHASLADGLAAAQRDGKPVLIDLWATWCKNCLTMDKTTLADQAVKAALDKYVKIKFQAEEPDQPPAKAVMQRFGAVGLPTYVILRPKLDRSARTAPPPAVP
jgi:cytochrome c biogenesis protein CcdA